MRDGRDYRKLIWSVSKIIWAFVWSCVKSQQVIQRSILLSFNSLLKFICLLIKIIFNRLITLIQINESLSVKSIRQINLQNKIKYFFFIYYSKKMIKSFSFHWLIKNTDGISLKLKKNKTKLKLIYQTKENVTKYCIFLLFIIWNKPHIQLRQMWEP